MKQKSFSELADMVAQLAEQSFKKGDSGAYSAFSVFLGALKQELRESMQEATQDPIRSIIGKLRSKQSLDAQELALVRLWIIGDAEYYSKSENNLKDWVCEVKRLVAEIQKFKDLPADAKNCMALHALALDLDRNLQDIIKLLEDLERVNRFSESTKEIDADEAAMLAKMLERKLASATM